MKIQMTSILKEIKVNLYTLTKAELSQLSESYKTRYVSYLNEEYGIQAVLTNNQLVIDQPYSQINHFHEETEEERKIEDSTEILLLTNDIEVPFSVSKSHVIYLTLGEGINLPEKFDVMPSFGITIDDNVNIQQFNIHMDMADKIFQERLLDFWDLDENFQTRHKTFTKNQIIRYSNYILEKGYYAPIVIHIDNCLNKYLIYI